MSFKLLLTASALLLASQVQASLPPLWASVREIQGMLNHPQLGNYLDSGDSIQKIERIPEGFEITTQRLSLHVIVEIKAPSSTQVGPSEYEYTFSKL